jgi:hypothetical protein
MEPRVKSSLDEQRVWLAPTWIDDDVPAVNCAQLERTLNRLGRNNRVNFFVTCTRQEDTGMNAALVATSQLQTYSRQRGFPVNDYVVLALVRSKRKYPQTGLHTYAAGMRVGRVLRLAGFTEADQARVLNEAGRWLQWDNPEPSPQEFIIEVCGKVCEELSEVYRGRSTRC